MERHNQRYRGSADNDCDDVDDREKRDHEQTEGQGPAQRMRLARRPLSWRGAPAAWSSRHCSVVRDRSGTFRLATGIDVNIYRNDPGGIWLAIVPTFDPVKPVQNYAMDN